MYVVLGASGNTGHIVANNLLASGQKVRVVGRIAAHLQPLAAKGAEPFIADATDAEALTRAFHQADSAYIVIPPNLTSSDPLGYSNRVSDAIAAAIQNAGTRNVVALSSIGADKSSGTGPVVGLHPLEQKLDQINGANVLCLRAAYFMENTLPQVNAIRQMGAVATPLRPDLKLPMIATRDIGAIAADALLHPTARGKQTRELLGQRDLTYTEVTAIIGKAIGKPNLKYVQAPDDQFRSALLQMGMSEPLARLLLEMIGSLNSGSMHALEARTPLNTTSTSYETFVAEYFVPAYQHQQQAVA
ncbi:MAG TPA: NmrA family NAD(P)-binding protein [Candidatus Sulfotelmatobacter sp.]|nr:NmrA family NAD(P)-binding protein [Candidatus Sulfotelmatobacter sp.]